MNTRKNNSICNIVMLLAFAVLLLTPLPSLAFKESEEDDIQAEIRREIERQSRETDLSSWQEWFEKSKALAADESGYGTVAEFVVSIALDGADTRPDNLLETLRELFLPGFKTAAVKMTVVAAIALLTGVCGIVIEEGATRKLVLLFLCSGAVLSCSGVFASAAGEIDAVIKDISGFCEVTAPVLGVLLTGVGASGTAALLTPKLAFIADGIAVMIRGVIIPMALASGVLTVLNALTGAFKLDRTVTLLQKTAKWVLGLAAVIYSAAAVTGGIGAAAADGVSLRSARFAIDRLIPSAGGMVSGAVDAVRAGSLLVKNSAVTVSILIIAALVMRPMMSAVCCMLAFRAAAALSEPFSDERIPKMLDGLADSLSLIFGAAAACCAMFIVITVMMMCAGSAVIA